MRLPGYNFLPLLFLPLLLLGCGSSITAPSPAQPRYPQLQGNWDLDVDLSGSDLLAYKGPLLDLRGALQNSEAEVTGTLHAIAGGNPSPCLLITENLPVGGTIDPLGHLNLTVPMAGGLATFQAKLSNDLHQYAHGSWQVIGGPCATLTAPAKAAQFASVSGTYTGALSVLDFKTGLPLAGSEIPVTITLSQSDLPDANGAFPLTGLLQASGPSCSSVYSFNHGVAFGNGVFDRALPNPTPSTSGGLFNGAVDPAGVTLFVSVTSFPGCTAARTGTLTRR